MKKLYLLDGYGLIYRGYFAMIRSPLHNAKGENISALYSALSSLISFYKKYNPDHFIIVFDPKGPTFRDTLYPEYKAHRDATPEDLHHQINQLQEFFSVMGMATLCVDNYEADDVLGTYVKLAQKHGVESYVLSNDKDLLQVVNEQTKVLKLDKGQFTEWGIEEVQENRGLHPSQIIDYLAILGDSADNIPGVKGIGDKGAQKLLQTYGSLDGIYAHLDELSKSHKEKLIASKDNAYLSQKLATICVDIPLEWNENFGDLSTINVRPGIALLKEWGVFKVAENWLLYFDSRFGSSDELFSDSFGVTSNKTKKEEEPETYFHTRQIEYETILTEEQCLDWFKRIKDQGIVAFDCETDSVDAMQATLCGVSFALAKNEACYLPLIAEGVECLPSSWVLPRLKELLEQKDLRIIGQNLKYDIKVMRHLDIRIHCWFDTMIAAWLLNSSGRHNMDYLAKTYLNYQTISFSEVVPKGSIFADIPYDKATQYASEDSDITWQLYEFFEPKLKEQKLWDLFRKIDIPLVNLLAKMEYLGIALEASQLQTFENELLPQITGLEEAIFELLGQRINLKSPKQLSECLFHEDSPFTSVKKTASGHSTNNSVLEALVRQVPDNPIPSLLIEYRALTKLYNTYVKTLPKEINPKTNRVHTSFLVTGTSTGRIASSDPNLQNIPVRDENGRRIRRAFIAPPGRLFLSADYSQVELVVLAHLSNDSGLKQAFANHVDIHRRTASRIFNRPEDQIDDQQRSIAKSINFGVIYGMSAFRLSNELNIPRAQAKSFIDAYFNEFSSVQSFIDSTLEDARKNEKVTTYLGHVRHLDYINSKNAVERKGAERMAVNTRIQGSAADIVKVAMLCLEKRIKAEKIDARILLQVHDECILEFAEEQKDTVLALVKEEMENAVSLSVPLTVGLSVGRNWGEIH